MKLSDLKTIDQIIEERRQRDPKFADHWDRTAFARRVAAVVIRYRDQRGITQQALADEVGFKQSAIARLEVGETPPSLTTLAKLSHATGLRFNLDVANGDVAMPDSKVVGDVEVFRVELVHRLRCHSGEQLTAEEIHQQGELLMDELLELEVCNPEMADPATSTDTSANTVAVEMDIAAPDESEATRVALYICRAAIHGIGGHTPGWPGSSPAVGATFEPQRLQLLYA